MQALIAARVGRHVLGALAEAFLILAIVAAIVLAAMPVLRTSIVPGVDAGRRTAATSLTVADGVFAGTTIARSGGADLWVHATCSQGGAMVFEQWIRTGSDGSGVLYLGPTPNWTSGAATCWAEDGTWTRSRWRQSSSTTFDVSG